MVKWPKNAGIVVRPLQDRQARDGALHSAKPSPHLVVGLWICMQTVDCAAAREIGYPTACRQGQDAAAGAGAVGSNSHIRRM